MTVNGTGETIAPGGTSTAIEGPRFVRKVEPSCVINVERAADTAASCASTELAEDGQTSEDSVFWQLKAVAITSEEASSIRQRLTTTILQAILCPRTTTPDSVLTGHCLHSVRHPCKSMNCQEVISLVFIVFLRLMKRVTFFGLTTVLSRVRSQRSFQVYLLHPKTSLRGSRSCI